MSYQVLARKWRPKTFTELVGQEHVVRALANGLDNERLHHAFLFTGTRGVGKTTIARIFAKALNCETGVKSEPCGECSACSEIDEGRFIDLIEVDAASRTKVDDTRELLENVQYAPTRGRYKVYLIDEVHMLSNSSFNALLKTFEEPPPHVKFLLATTDPQKLPVTVLSRCLQFNLKRMPASQIAPYLVELLGRESIEHDADAVQLIAEAADGSMRDGLSLLDQSIAHGGGALRVDEVRAMLGTVERRHTVGLLKALAERDADALWETSQQLIQFSPNFANVLRDLAAALHRMAVAAAVPNNGGLDTDLTDVAATMDPEDIQLYYQIATHGRRDLDLAPDQQTGFEMTLLRMLAFRPLGDDESSTDAGRQGGNESGASGTGGITASSTATAKAEAARIAGIVTKPVATKSQPASVAAPSVDAAPAEPLSMSNSPPRPATEMIGDEHPAQGGVSAVPDVPVGADLASVQVAETTTTYGERTPSQDIVDGDDMADMSQDAAPDLMGDDLGWDDLISHLGLTGPAGIVAANSVLRREEHGHYKVILDQQHAHMHMPSIEKKIMEALQRFFGQHANIQFVVGQLDAESPALKRSRVQDENAEAAQGAIEADPVVQALQRDFAATIVPDSVKYLN